MIKFFRKIRQKLLSENKFSKYLIYAIGEIILVIIGILIALAINQKNTDKNNNELRNLYLIQLNDETDLNIKELIEYKNRYIKRLTELDTLFQILVNKEYNNPKLLSKSTKLYGRLTFEPIMTTYENLKFSGDLKLFSDIKLRNSISETYNTFNDIKTNEKIDLKVIDVYYQDYYMLNAKLTNLNLSSNNFGKDDYFENTVSVRRITIRQVIDSYEYSIESLEKLKIIFADLQKSN
jgi:hypothetical protein